MELFDVYLLVGLKKESDDYYWELMDRHGKIELDSCVGSLIFLKEHFPAKLYAHLCDLFYINAIEPKMAYFSEIEKEITMKIGRKPKTPIWG